MRPPFNKFENKNKNKTRSTIAVDPRHLKVKEYNISLTKTYNITISIQKFNSIHKFTLTMQQMLGSHELKGHGYF